MNDIEQGPPQVPGTLATSDGGKRLRRRHLASRVGLGAVLACGLAAGSYGIAAAASSHGTAPGTTSQALSAPPSSSKSPSPAAPSPSPVPRFGPGYPRPGLFGPFGGGFGPAGFARGGTVTKLGATTITVESEFGSKVTVTTNASTSYSEAGKSVARSVLAVGDQVVFQSVHSSPPSSGTSPVVRAVEIVLPHVSGKVVSINGPQVVVEQSDGLYVTVNTSATTSYDEAGQSAPSSDMHTGSVVSVTGTLTADHEQINATAIEIVLAEVSGQVTGVSGTTITITGFGKATETLTTDSATVFRDNSGKTTISTVADGDLVQAFGSAGSGSSFAARAVYIGAAVPSPPGGPGPTSGSYGGGRVFGGAWNRPGGAGPAAGMIANNGGLFQSA